MSELPVIQKVYDLIKWYVPILNRLPHSHKFILGERIINQLYDLLEGLINARYSRQKLPLLESLNIKLDILRYQTRLLYHFRLISLERYEYIGKQLQEIGTDLGSWIKQQKRSQN
jgi:hypothetical protein